MKVSLAQPEVVTRKGKPVSVILPIKVYENLLDRVEDRALMKKARQNPLQFRPLKDYLAEQRKTHV